MPTATKQNDKATAQAERTEEREKELEQLLGAAGLAALKTQPGLKGLCKDCANREICRKRKPGEVVMSCASHRVGPAISPKAFKSFAEVVDFAVENEERVYAFYRELASQVKQASTRKALKAFAKRSMRHKKRLLKMKRAGSSAIAPSDVQNLRITKYVTKEVTPGEDMDTREALILAIKNAALSQDLYNDLAAHADDDDIQAMFAALAQEEAEQKLKLETEYDDYVFAQD